MNDKLDAAIAAAAANDEPDPNVAWFDIALLNNKTRMAHVKVPADIGDLELLHLIGNILGIGDRLRSNRKSSGILVPAHVNREAAAAQSEPAE